MSRQQQSFAVHRSQRLETLWRMSSRRCRHTSAACSVLKLFPSSSSLILWTARSSTAFSCFRCAIVAASSSSSATPSVSALASPASSAACSASAAALWPNSASSPVSPLGLSTSAASSDAGGVPVSSDGTVKPDCARRSRCCPSASAASLSSTAWRYLDDSKASFACFRSPSRREDRSRTAQPTHWLHRAASSMLMHRCRTWRRQ